MHTVTVAERPTLESTTVGPGRWHEVSQQWVNQFADAAQAINYELGKARFPAPVPVGSRVRLGAMEATVGGAK
jgi:hypothetical protein